MGAVVSELLAEALSRRRTALAQPAFRWTSPDMKPLVDRSDKEAVSAAMDGDDPDFCSRLLAHALSVFRAKGSDAFDGVGAKRFLAGRTGDCAAGALGRPADPAGRPDDDGRGRAITNRRRSRADGWSAEGSNRAEMAVEARIESLILAGRHILALAAEIRLLADFPCALDAR